MLRNVLIFQLGALGDFLVTWPLAMALSRLHPQSRIIYITHPQKGALAEKVLRIESASIESGWHHLFGNPAALPPAAAKMLAAAHSIYSFIAGDADAWTASVRRLAPQARVCCIQPRPADDYDGHVTGHHLEQLGAHQAITAAMRQMLQFIGDRGVGYGLPGGRTVVIHPGSGSPGKCWPLDRYLRLADLLAAQGRPVRFVIGEAELERWPEARIGALASAGELRRPGTLVGLLEALSDAGVYIGNDSGPSHLAGLLGLPAVCLFGPSDPAVWRPLGPRVRILAPMEDVAPEAALEALATP
jgi:heptosyltransferase III